MKDLKTDPGHQTLPQAELNKYNNYAATGIKTSLADYANSINAASGYYQLVSENDKHNWNTAAEYLEDTLHTAAQKNDFALLANRPDYAEVIYTGNYNDLQDKPDFQRTFIESNQLNDLKNAPTSWPRLWLSCSLNDVPGHPDFAAVAKSGEYKDLKNKPASLADLAEDAQSVHITAEQKEAYGNIYNFYKGSGDFDAVRCQNDVVGSWDEPSLHLRESPDFPAGLKLSSPKPNPPSNTNNFNRIPTVGNLKAMDKDYQTASTSAYPEGTVLISSKALTDEMRKAGWCYFTQMENRFPVAVNAEIDNGNPDLFGYTQGYTGGSSNVTLEIEHMPKHRHKVYESRKEGEHGGHNGVAWPPVVSETERVDNLTNGNYTNTFIGVAGGSKSHENRPPFRAVYFIIKSKNYCK